MTWNAWPASLEKQRSLRMLCCDFRFQAHRAGSVGVGAMQSHFGADPAELLNGGAARVGALRGAELAGIHIYSGGQIQSADKLAGTFEHAIHLAEQIAQAGYPCAFSILAAGSHGHLEPRILPWTSPLCGKNYSV